MFVGLAHGLASALQPMNLVAALVGVILGTLVGVLPGMTPTATIAVLLTFTARLNTEPAFIMLAGIYFGAQYGNSITAILLNIPSEPQSVVIARHGFRLTQRGRAGAALSCAAIGSFVGVIVGLVGLSLVAPALSRLAEAFGPPEFFAVTAAGLVAIVIVMNKGGPAGILSVCLGLALSTVGVDPVESVNRFTFGIPGLLAGMQLVPIAVGLFGMAELLDRYVRNQRVASMVQVGSFSELRPTASELKATAWSGLRGGIMGFLLGSIPGPSILMGVFGSYAAEERLAMRKYGTEELEKGQIELVAGPKAADDAAASGSLVPLLTLGLPFTPVTAMLFAALLLHNITPGPLFIADNPSIFWGLVAAMGIGNIVLLILNFPLVGVWIRLLRIPEKYRFAILMLVMMLGVYALRYSFFDLWVLCIAGVLGTILHRVGFDRLLIVLGLIIGTPMEQSLRQSLLLSKGNPMVFVTQPVSLGIFLALAAFIVAWRVLRRKSPSGAHSM